MDKYIVYHKMLLVAYGARYCLISPNLAGIDPQECLLGLKKPGLYYMPMAPMSWPIFGTFRWT